MEKVGVGSTSWRGMKQQHFKEAVKASQRDETWKQ